MRILVNFLPIYKGGGLQNAVNFWRTSLSKDDDYWVCLTRQGSEISELPQDDKHVILEVNVSGNYILRLLKDNILIRQMVKRYEIDVVFTLAGPGPLRGNFCSVNGWHEPAYVYPESDFWNRISAFSRVLLWLKYLYSTIVLKRANAVTVQTNTMKKRMIEYRKISEDKLWIVPNGITSYSDVEYISDRLDKVFKKLKGRIKLLVLTEPWVHKNLNFLIKVAQGLNDEFVFCVSIDRTTNKLASEFIDLVKSKGLEDRIVFLGRIEHKEIRSVYQRIDAVFLPTLLESFSANYVEAMYFEKPLFTSNLDFAIEVCGDYAYYFDPFIEDTAIVLLNWFNNVDREEEIRNRILTNRISYPEWDERFNKYYSIIQQAVRDMEKTG